ncbi:hypothetical protein CSUI_005382 [Cystoisospora suis]|uniref:RAP domain-containing protein n=1 Tax=Cystoisospora suis TaxID=483139 RepID=A0A2C6KXA8_9APIC|nr:hypothetical protein CSUI_005382 [Cystoisospora suis]
MAFHVGNSRGCINCFFRRFGAPKNAHNGVLGSFGECAHFANSSLVQSGTSVSPWLRSLGRALSCLCGRRTAFSLSHRRCVGNLSAARNALPGNASVDEKEARNRAEALRAGNGRLAERSALVREARRACVQKNNLVDIYRASELVESSLMGRDVASGDIATLLNLFAKKKFMHKPFWRSVGKSILPRLKELDPKCMALVLNSFAQVGVLDFRLLRKAAALIVQGHRAEHDSVHPKHSLIQGGMMPGGASKRTVTSEKSSDEVLSEEAAGNSENGVWEWRKAACAAEGKAVVEQPEDRERSGRPEPRGGDLRRGGVATSHSPAGEHSQRQQHHPGDVEHGDVGVPKRGSLSKTLREGPSSSVPSRRRLERAFPQEGVEAFLVPSVVGSRLKRGEMTFLKSSRDGSAGEQLERSEGVRSVPPRGHAAGADHDAGPGRSIYVTVCGALAEVYGSGDFQSDPAVDGDTGFHQHERTAAAPHHFRGIPDSFSRREGPILGTGDGRGISCETSNLAGSIFFPTKSASFRSSCAHPEEPRRQSNVIGQQIRDKSIIQAHDSSVTPVAGSRGRVGGILPGEGPTNLLKQAPRCASPAGEVSLDSLVCGGEELPTCRGSAAGGTRDSSNQEGITLRGSGASRALVHAMNAQDISLVANAFAKLGVTDRALFSSLAGRLSHVIREASGLQLTISFAAFSKVGLGDMGVCRLIAKELCKSQIEQTEGQNAGVKANDVEARAVLQEPLSVTEWPQQAHTKERLNLSPADDKDGLRHFFPDADLSFIVVPPKIRELDSSAVALLLSYMHTAKFADRELSSALLSHLEYSPSRNKRNSRKADLPVHTALKQTGSGESSSRIAELSSSKRVRSGSLVEVVGRKPSTLQMEPTGTLCEKKDLLQFQGKAEESKDGSRASGSRFRALYHDLGPRDVSLVLNALWSLPHPDTLRGAIVARAIELLSSMNDADILITTKALGRLRQSLPRSQVEDLFLHVRSRFRAHACGIKGLVSLAGVLQCLVALGPVLQVPARNVLIDIMPRLENRLYKLDNRGLLQLASALTSLHAWEESVALELFVEFSRRIESFTLAEKLGVFQVTRDFFRSGATAAAELASFVIRAIVSDASEGFSSGKLVWTSAKIAALVSSASELRVLTDSAMSVVLPLLFTSVDTMSLEEQLSTAMALLAAEPICVAPQAVQLIWTSVVERVLGQSNGDALVRACLGTTGASVNDHVNPSGYETQATTKACAPDEAQSYAENVSVLEPTPARPPTEDSELSRKVEQDGAERSAEPCDQSQRSPRLQCRLLRLRARMLKVLLGGFLVGRPDLTIPYCTASESATRDLTVPCRTEPASVKRGPGSGTPAGVDEGGCLTRSNRRGDCGSWETISRLRHMQHALDRHGVSAQLQASSALHVREIPLSSSVTKSLMRSLDCHESSLQTMLVDEGQGPRSKIEGLHAEVTEAAVRISSELWQAHINGLLLRESRALDGIQGCLPRSLPVVQIASVSDTESQTFGERTAAQLRRSFAKRCFARFRPVHDGSGRSASGAYGLDTDGAQADECHAAWRPRLYSRAAAGPLFVHLIVDLPPPVFRSKGAAHPNFSLNR